MEKLQAVWEAKDLDGFLSMFTEDAVVRVLHENKTLEGEEREKGGRGGGRRGRGGGRDRK